MKYKCPNKDCCTCHTEGHEWEGKQSSKYYIKCPMCKTDFKIFDAFTNQKQQLKDNIGEM